MMVQTGLDLIIGNLKKRKDIKMKKIFKFLLTFAVIFTLMNCKVKVQPKQIQAQNGIISINGDGWDDYKIGFKSVSIDGITYLIYTKKDEFEVLNHTKEKLEVEKLRAEIKYLKRHTPTL